VRLGYSGAKSSVSPIVCTTSRKPVPYRGKASENFGITVAGFPRPPDSRMTRPQQNPGCPKRFTPVRPISLVVGRFCPVAEAMARDLAFFNSKS
jgi:hypothetical protein